MIQTVGMEVAGLGLGALVAAALMDVTGLGITQTYAAAGA